MIDTNSNLDYLNVSGTLCVRRIEINGTNLDELRGDIVYDTPIDPTTHGAEIISSTTGGAVAEILQSGVARFTLPPEGGLE